MKKRIISFLLVLTMVLGLIPMTALAADRDESKDQVHVIVENTTCSKEAGAPWTGTLVDTWVELTPESTMMSCVGAALSEKGCTAEGLDSGYISSVNGLSAGTGASYAGWMGTLNDWFTNEGFSAYTVAKGTLGSGDEIRIMYSLTMGEDLGGSWGNKDTSLKDLTFSAGTLSPVFDGKTLEYTLTVPDFVEDIVVTPTAANKYFQTHVKSGSQEYKRTTSVPIAEGTVLSIECGTGPSMNGDATPTVYTVTIHKLDAANPNLGFEWPSFRGNNENNGITDVFVPTTAQDTDIKWIKQMSTGWSDPVSPMLLVDNSLIVMVGRNLKKVSKETGEVLASAELADAPSWGTTSPTYGAGMIFCPLSNSKVQAFDAVTLDSLWIYDDETDGQAQSPITYADGKIYVGLGYGNGSCFVCLNAEDGSLVWRDANDTGYYWAGALVRGDYVIYGGDNGHIISRNKDTGDVITDLEVEGTPNIRSTVSYADGQIFFSTKTSLFCKADLNGETGEITNLVTLDCSEFGAESTSTPAVYNGIAYFGVGAWSAPQSIVAVSLETMEVLWHLDAPANPQCSVLISTAYENSGYIYLYYTYNKNPGGINVIRAKADGSEATSAVLYDAADHEQYCICSVIADEDGNLYYKNDSNCIFKLGLTQAATDQLAIARVTGLIEAIGNVTVDSKDSIAAAREAYDALTDALKEEITNYDVLVDAEYKLSQLTKPHADFKAIYNTTGDYLEKLCKEQTPGVNSVGGEWTIIGLARSGREVPSGYYNNVVSYVNEKINAHEQLSRSKSTDNSRVILALNAIGIDPRDIGGHNLLKGLDDMTYLKKQGINGPIWALIALNSYNYKQDSSLKNVTVKNLVDYILSQQLDDGGWALTDEKSDPDITAMALTALSDFYGTDKSVKASVDAAIKALSAMQLGDGGFASLGTANSESTAQVIVALTSLKIDPNTDPRFIKNGRSVVDALCEFYTEGGGFSHTAGQERNGMSTEQGYYALVAYFRFLNHNNTLFNMDDVVMLPFSDISNDAWYRNDVVFVYSTRIMKGTGNGFEPGSNLTRGQMAAILYRMASVCEDAPVKVSGKNVFTDVTSDSYYAESVIWAHENGITNGTSATTFSPNEPVTRAQMAVFLSRFAEKYFHLNVDSKEDLSRFTDSSKIPTYAAESMKWAVEQGLVEGTSKTELSPVDEVTRAQTAALANRMFNFLKA